MKKTERLIMAACLLFFGLSFSSPVLAYNVTIGDFGGTGNSTSGAFINGVWTPTGDSNLDDADLLSELTNNNVEVTTNGSGDITVNDSFGDTLDVNRQLTLSATGNILVSGIQATGLGSLSLVTTASGTVTFDVAGTTLNGGSFTSSGTDIFVSGYGIQTNGGNVRLNHTGTITLANSGISTGSGSFTAWGSDMTSNDNGLITDGSAVELTLTGTLRIGGSGIRTNGGSFTSSGTDIFIDDGGLLTGGGDVDLSASNNLSLLAGGVETGGGLFSSTGIDMMVAGGGIVTSGGDVKMKQSGAITITDGGIETDGGSFESAGTTFSCDNGGMHTNGGNVLVESNGLITLASNAPFYSGDENVGGTITLKSTTGITDGGDISTAPGSGGMFYLKGNTNAIAVNQPVTLGAGDITLSVSGYAFTFTNTVDDPTPSLGQTVTFTITFTNQGHWAGSGVVITDLLPSQVTYVSHHASQGTYDKNNGQWDVGSMAVDETATLEITATINHTCLITNTAEITASTPALFGSTTAAVTLLASNTSSSSSGGGCFIGAISKP